MNNLSFYKLERGFTIIEIVVVLAVFSIIIMGVVALVSGVFVQGTREGTSLADTDQARKLGLRFTQELRNAVYGNTGGYPLNSAGDQQIIFFSNVDDDSDIERIRYYLQSGAMYRGVTQPTGNPTVYDTNGESSRVVQNNVANGATPLFYYYNESYDGSTGTALSQPVNITQATFVRLNLQVFNKAASATKYYTVTSGTSIRSIKTNLGD